MYYYFVNDETERKHGHIIVLLLTSVTNIILHKNEFKSISFIILPQ